MGRKKYGSIQEALDDTPSAKHWSDYRDVRIGNNMVTLRKGEKPEPGIPLMKDPGPYKKIAKAITK